MEMILSQAQRAKKCFRHIILSIAIIVLAHWFWVSKEIFSKKKKRRQNYCALAYHN